MRGPHVCLQPERAPKKKMLRGNFFWSDLSEARTKRRMNQGDPDVIMWSGRNLQENIVLCRMLFVAMVGGT